MPQKIHHIAVAVQDIKSALPVFRDALGLTVAHVEDVEGQGVKTAMLSLGDTGLELIAPLTASSPVALFLQRHGEGIHHICLEVENLEVALLRLKANGMRLVDEQPRLGADGALVAFVHPSSTHGVLLELRQSKKEL